MSVSLIQARDSPLSFVARPGFKLHAIVDATLAECLNVSHLPLDSTPVRIASEVHDDPDGLPWLLRLTPDHRDWLVNMSRRSDWGILVESTLSDHALRIALSARLNAIDDQEQLYYLRYYDPRVLEPLLMSFSRDEAARWFDGIDAFGCIQGEHIRWLSPAHHVLHAKGPAALSPLRIRSEHLEPFDHVDSSIMLDELRAFIEHERPGIFGGLPDQTVHQMLRNAVIRASRHNITSRVDVAAFAAIMLDVAPNFDEHPEILACLKLPLLTGALRLRAAIEMCSDLAWEQAEQDADMSAWLDDHTANNRNP